jgi:FtsH-binding integral membrane protein
MQPDLRTVQTGRPAASGDFALQQNKVLRNTYMLLALSLIPTAIGAAIGTNIDMSFIRTSPGLSLIGILVLFYGWIYAIERNKESSLGVVLLLGFTLFLGLLLGPLLHRTLGFSNGTELVMMAAGGTAAVFFVMAGVASSTKRNFSGLTNFLAVGSVVLMLGVVASLFVHSPVFYLVVLGAFVLFSSLMIMWQVNRIVQGGETNYISATLTLYISIYNLFSALLQLLGMGGRD